MDDITPTQRKKCMSRIRSNNTKIEIELKKELRNRGIKSYRINNSKIFGRPDLFFPKNKVAVFIDGCFWHNCPICALHSKSNLDYWDKKMERNKNRDSEVNYELSKQGIKIIRIWEHELKSNKLQICNGLAKLLA